MTVPATSAKPISPWDEAPADPAVDAAGNIARIVSGNPHLVEYPGLVDALHSSGATPLQAAAVNSFMSILNAEKAVRVAAGDPASPKIRLSPEQEAGLQSIGVNYQPYVYRQKDAVQTLTEDMGKQGLAPVLNKAGEVMVDAHGNPLAQAAPQPQAAPADHGWFSSFGDFFHHLTHNIVTDDTFGGNSTGGNAAAELGQRPMGTTGEMLAGGYNLVNSTLSEAPAMSDPMKAIAQQQGNDDLMRALGMDPNSVVDQLTFRYKGYAHSNTQPLADGWDAQHPAGGLFGWDGQTAVTEAEKFAVDPASYRTGILNEQGLTDNQRADKLNALDHDQEFQRLVAQVNGQKADIGTDFARGIGIDPAAHATTFNYTAAAANFIGSFLTDPLGIAGAAANRARMAGTAMKNLADKEDVLRILRDGDVTGGVLNVRRHLRDMVDWTGELRQARDAGDLAAQARVMAKIQRNPFAPLAEDFNGVNRIAGHRAPLDKEDLGFVTNNTGEVIDTYDKAVEYIADYGALLKLTKGHAPVESSVMPGALSSYGWNRLRGSLSSWSAGHSADRLLKQIDKYKGWAADPAGGTHIFNEDTVLRTIAEADNAYDVAHGVWIAARDRLSAAEQRLADLAGQEPDFSTLREKIDKLRATGDSLGGPASQAYHAKADQFQAVIDDTLSGLERDRRSAAAEHNAASDAFDRASTERAARAQDARTAKLATPSEGRRLGDEAIGQMQRNLYDFGRINTPKIAEHALRQAASENKWESFVGNVKLIGLGLPGTAARARLAASRFHTLLPNDYELATDSAAGADWIERVARTYLNKGHASMLAARWTLGDNETRKSIVEALRAQIAHAAGLGRTRLGREEMKTWGTADQKYTVVEGNEIRDQAGQAAAMYAGQIQRKFRLPHFGKVHQAAAKIGLLEATIGRLLGHQIVSKLMVQWKLGALIGWVTPMRASIEGWLNATADGQLVDGLRAKALQHDLKGLYSDGMLRRSRPFDWAASLYPLRKFGQVYRHVLLQGVNVKGYSLLKGIDKAELNAILTMPHDLLLDMIHHQAAEHYATAMDPAGVTEASDAAAAGFNLRRLKYDAKNGWHIAMRRRTGYQLTDNIEGVHGATAYAHNLSMRVNDSPDTARAILAYLTGLKSEDQLTEIVKSIEVDPLMRDSMFGKVYWQGDEQLNASTAEQIAEGKTQWAQRMTADMSALITGRNGLINKDIAEFITEHGKAPSEEWLLDNVGGLRRPAAMNKGIYIALGKYKLLADGDKKILTDLLEKRRLGEFADRARSVGLTDDQIKYLTDRAGDQRPAKLLEPVFEDLDRKSATDGFMKGLFDREGKAYSWMVERPIQRITTAPMFTAAYARSKVSLEATKARLIEDGITEDTAEAMVRHWAQGQAWERVRRMVDDPVMKTQLDIVGRNFFAFSRATTMMLRRWGDTFWRNPVAARRMWLAWEGAQHAGMIHKDVNGDSVFSFPGSGVAQEALLHALSVLPGMNGLAKFPVSDFTGKVSTIIPGSDNPLQYQWAPLVSISLRDIASHFPAYRSWFDAVDQKFNGAAGAGQGVVATLTPTIAKRVTDIAWPELSGQDPWQARDSQTASAMIGSIYYLSLAGLLPPADATYQQQEEAKSRIAVGAQSQLYVRALFSMLSPASLGLPDNGDGTADYAYIQSGIRGLRDEFLQLVNDVKGDYPRALAIWTRLHPDDTVFTQSKSQATTAHTYLPSTTKALDWMQQNTGFIDKYKNVAAFFLPPAANTDPYSSAAYNAQIEDGMRERKTPQEFLDGARVASASTLYYDQEDRYKKMLAQAKGQNDSAQVAYLQDRWAGWSKDFLARNPTFAVHRYQGSSLNVNAKEQLASLEQMVQSGEVPNGPRMQQAVSGMVTAWRQYQDAKLHYPGQDTYSRSQKSALFTQFQDYLSSVVKAVPEASALYTGIFRSLDNQLAQLP